MLDNNSIETVFIKNYEIQISKSNLRISMCICVGFLFSQP